MPEVRGNAQREPAAEISMRLNILIPQGHGILPYYRDHYDALRRLDAGSSGGREAAAALVPARTYDLKTAAGPLHAGHAPATG